MKIKGYSTGLFGWQVPYWDQGKDISWEGILRDCAEAGFDAVEIDPEPELLDMARANGLAVSGSYFGLPLHEAFETIQFEDKVLRAAERLAEAGGSDMLINADPKGGWDYPELKTEDDFKRQGDNLSRIATAVSSLGLKVVMHNHSAERPDAEGDFRSVIEYASKEVGLCIDTGWAYVAGIDPVELIRSHPERLHALHLRNQRGSVPSEDLIEGDIDMRRLLGVLAQSGYAGWLTLELWHRNDTRPAQTFKDANRRSIAFMKEHLSLLNN